MRVSPIAKLITDTVKPSSNSFYFRGDGTAQAVIPVILFASRPGKTDADLFPDAPRRFVEKQNPVGQQHRFPHVMGHEKDGVGKFPPEPQQQIL
ncbi:MAG TPA: hypothetical protein VK852_14685, partial [Desulfobacterales bacterium]|nr:hypothetical protein [Desulfobacterales bacterium]